MLMYLTETNMKKTLTLEYTTNTSPVDIDATLTHHNVDATTRIMRTYPSKRYEVIVDASVDAKHIMKICNANAVMEPRSK